jgi:uncharacterized protein YggU (UPF0235/DUF167 family)
LAGRRADRARSRSLKAGLRVRLTPSGGADRIDGAGADAGGLYLKARVRAVAEDGKANAALCALIARALSLAKTRISIVRGAASRMKTLEIEGANADDIAAFVAGFEEHP